MVKVVVIISRNLSFGYLKYPFTLQVTLSVRCGLHAIIKVEANPPSLTLSLLVLFPPKADKLSRLKERFTAGLIYTRIFRRLHLKYSDKSKNRPRPCGKELKLEISLLTRSAGDNIARFASCQPSNNGLDFFAYERQTLADHLFNCLCRFAGSWDYFAVIAVFGRDLSCKSSPNWLIDCNLLFISINRLANIR